MMNGVQMSLPAILQLFAPEGFVLTKFLPSSFYPLVRALARQFQVEPERGPFGWNSQVK